MLLSLCLSLRLDFGIWIKYPYYPCLLYYRWMKPCPSAGSWFVSWIYIHCKDYDYLFDYYGRCDVSICELLRYSLSMDAKGRLVEKSDTNSFHHNGIFSGTPLCYRPIPMMVQNWNLNQAGWGQRYNHTKLRDFFLFEEWTCGWGGWGWNRGQWKQVHRRWVER